VSSTNGQKYKMSGVIFSGVFVWSVIVWHHRVLNLGQGGRSPKKDH
jgi:hypothetical protein